VIKISCTTFAYDHKMRHVNDPYQTMKDEIGFSNKGKMGLEDFIKKVYDLRLDGVEFTNYYFPSVESSYLKKVKRMALSYGLDISAVACGNDFCIPDRQKREEQIKFVKKWTDIAYEMGAPVLRIFTGAFPWPQAKPAGYTEDDLFKWAVECMKECAKYAEQKGVVLALENHHDFGTRADNVIKMIEAVNSEWLRHLLDPVNYREHAYSDSKKAAPYAVYAHAKATTGIWPEWAGIKGNWSIDYRRIKEILDDVGYNGYISVEYEGTEDPDIGVPKLAELLKTIFK
jgi:L-ribulose-5-phosphate 3-epimerase